MDKSSFAANWVPVYAAILAVGGLGIFVFPYWASMIVIALGIAASLFMRWAGWKQYPHS